MQRLLDPSQEIILRAWSSAHSQLPERFGGPESIQKATKQVVKTTFVVDVLLFHVCHTFQNVHPNQLRSLWPGPDFPFQIVLCLQQNRKAKPVLVDQAQEWGDLGTAQPRETTILSCFWDLSKHWPAKGHYFLSQSTHRVSLFWRWPPTGHPLSVRVFCCPVEQKLERTSSGPEALFLLFMQNR